MAVLTLYFNLYLLVFPFHTDCRLGCTIFFGHWDNSKSDINRDLKIACALGLCFSLARFENSVTPTM